MQETFASWMIAGGPFTDEHDQRIAHLVAIRERRQAERAERPGLLDRVRSRFGIASPAETLDCCVA
jgi:hypothetical protein